MLLKENLLTDFLSKPYYSQDHSFEIKNFKDKYLDKKNLYTEYSESVIDDLPKWMIDILLNEKANNDLNRIIYNLMCNKEFLEKILTEYEISKSDKDKIETPYYKLSSVICRKCLEIDENISILGEHMKNKPYYGMRYRISNSEERNKDQFAEKNIRA